MSSLPVLAEASSKLHADIAMIRLLRAGIRSDKISAVFPRGRAPNSVCCWLSSFQRVPIASTLPLAAAGLFGRLFRNGYRSENFHRQVEKLGLTPDMTSRLIHKMEDGRIVLCVHARNESEAAVAWHIFHHVGAEIITSPVDVSDHRQREVPALTPQWAGVAA
jgi:hypothetical protein